MREQNVPGIYGIDTRALTKIVRESGVMNGIILSELPEDKSKVLWDIKQYRITEAVANTSRSEREVHLHTNETEHPKKIVLLDLGAKKDDLPSASDEGLRRDNRSLQYLREEIIAMKPDGIMLSNGGWKEIEYEVMRDKADNCIIVCNMENVDPVGVHTGDSIVVAPSQTLNDLQYQMLRTASLDIIRRLKIEGGCNVQYALDPNSNQYYVIEVNPRVSRSSALASKATGYPIAKVAAKVATGLTLDQITNAVTGKTTACFEPTLDYCVVKFPRWPFEKFALADKSLGTQMKATGEVMSLDRCFEGALLKAVRSLEIGVNYISMKKLESKSLIDIVELLQKQDDERLFVVAQALRLGISEEKIHYITGYDLWFLHKIKNIIDVEFDLQRNNLTIDNVRLAKRYSMPDAVIAGFTKKTEEEVRQFRVDHGITPTFKMVDTCAAEFEAATPYYYSCYATEDEVKPLGKKSVIA